MSNLSIGIQELANVKALRKAPNFKGMNLMSSLRDVQSEDTFETESKTALKDEPVNQQEETELSFKGGKTRVKKNGSSKSLKLLLAAMMGLVTVAGMTSCEKEKEEDLRPGVIIYDNSSHNVDVDVNVTTILNMHFNTTIVNNITNNYTTVLNNTTIINNPDISDEEFLTRLDSLYALIDRNGQRDHEDHLAMMQLMMDFGVSLEAIERWMSLYNIKLEDLLQNQQQLVNIAQSCLDKLGSLEQGQDDLRQFVSNIFYEVRHLSQLGQISNDKLDAIEQFLLTLIQKADILTNTARAGFTNISSQLSGLETVYIVGMNNLMAKLDTMDENQRNAALNNMAQLNVIISLIRYGNDRADDIYNIALDILGSQTNLSDNFMQMLAQMVQNGATLDEIKQAVIETRNATVANGQTLISMNNQLRFFRASFEAFKLQCFAQHADLMAHLNARFSNIEDKLDSLIAKPDCNCDIDAIYTVLIRIATLLEQVTDENTHEGEFEGEFETLSNLLGND